MSLKPEPLSALVGEIVVIDLDDRWIAFGTLARVADDWLELADADLHDLREGSSTRDVYALETQRFGVRANRRRVILPLARVVALARLAEVTA